MGKKNSSSSPYPAKVTSKAYGFVKTFAGKNPVSIEFFVGDNKLTLFDSIASHVDDPRFRGTPFTLASGYEFSPMYTDGFDTIICGICEDVDELVRELVKYGLPKEAIVSALAKCKNDDEAVYTFIDSINEGFVEMMEARASEAGQETDYGGWGGEATGNGWDATESSENWESDSSGDDWWQDEESNQDSEEISDDDAATDVVDGEEAAEEEQAGDEPEAPLTPAQVSALLSKRFDELKKEAKNQLPKKAKKEDWEELAFDLLKAEYPDYMEGLEYAPAS